MTQEKFDLKMLDVVWRTQVTEKELEKVRSGLKIGYSLLVAVAHTLMEESEEIFWNPACEAQKNAYRYVAFTVAICDGKFNPNTNMRIIVKEGKEDEARQTSNTQPVDKEEAISEVTLHFFQEGLERLTQKGANILEIIDYVTKMSFRSLETENEEKATDARVMQRGLERFHQILQAAQEAGL